MINTVVEGKDLIKPDDLDRPDHWASFVDYDSSWKQSALGLPVHLASQPASRRVADGHQSREGETVLLDAKRVRERSGSKGPFELFPGRSTSSGTAARGSAV
jgi:hypothetical protein